MICCVILHVVSVLLLFSFFWKPKSALGLHWLYMYYLCCFGSINGYNQHTLHSCYSALVLKFVFIVFCFFFPRTSDCAQYWSENGELFLSSHRQNYFQIVWRKLDVRVKQQFLNGTASHYPIVNSTKTWNSVNLWPILSFRAKARTRSPEIKTSQKLKFQFWLDLSRNIPWRCMVKLDTALKR